MRREAPQPSDAEWKVLHALWNKHPATARELLDRLSREQWAYTTLKTMLTRMEEKGLVRSGMQGNTASYEPAVEQHAAERDAVRSLLRRVFDGAAGPLLAHRAEQEELSDSDRRALRKRLSARPRKERPSDR
ncbi:MAG: BlaI/MecI/CopY family transcriptional regulator [Planctomycetes bacterium]|nr:BlaI/MecI/CopY family transcriptional regulator [Planctomycetota bacterium]